MTEKRKALIFRVFLFDCLFFVFCFFNLTLITHALLVILFFSSDTFVLEPYVEKIVAKIIKTSLNELVLYDKIDSDSIEFT